MYHLLYHRNVCSLGWASRAKPLAHARKRIRAFPVAAAVSDLNFECQALFSQYIFNSSFFIMFRLNQVYIYICNQVEIPNLTRKGGSKYGVHQGYGCIWRMYPFYMFVLCKFRKNRGSKYEVQQGMVPFWGI